VFRQHHVRLVNGGDAPRHFYQLRAAHAGKRALKTDVVVFKAADKLALFRVIHKLPLPYIGILSVRREDVIPKSG